jgi:hypothetical protein
MIVTINGRAVSGTASEIGEILAEVERKTSGGTYFSDSKNEELYIADMDTNHIRNAVFKMLREKVARLVHFSDNEALVEEIESDMIGLAPYDVFVNLLAELKTR